MESSLALLALLSAASVLLSGVAQGQEEEESQELQPRAVDLYSTMEDTSREKELCDAGEQCAVRKGARIGKLCDCPRGTSCNTFLLKCL
ncbi:hypothetical protein JD844_008716 [Phrynosoma platyrhinos]|uniref:Cocaine- and amphetamine-regulated transcript protein n=1 Tax=Phrynosoma platyrhinos TaxID=52577 RepID=A0ABQ7TES3_PHRPL|nr:hypothetical protein JD844_008716 [Phrynosoma platyrhinos]